jgi:hypothetical protein
MVWSPSENWHWYIYTGASFIYFVPLVYKYTRLFYCDDILPIWICSLAEKSNTLAYGSVDVPDIQLKQNMVLQCIVQLPILNMQLVSLLIFAGAPCSSHKIL